jgi:hypothetical protein
MTLVITPLNALIKPDPTSESNPITNHAVAAVTTVSNMVKMSSIAEAHLPRAPTNDKHLTVTAPLLRGHRLPITMTVNNAQ